ncbi:MAG: glycosyltransferase family 2 protein [Candidatus Hodarchaeales archaeon]
MEESKQNRLLIIIPARNEEQSLNVLLPRIFQITPAQVLVVDNGSTDDTREVARKAGATVIHERKPGYGSACLAGISYVASLSHPPDNICFFDGDGQCSVDDISLVAHHVFSGEYKFCQGSRMMSTASRTGIPSLAQVANRFFGMLLTSIWKQPVTDLGPLRVITWKYLTELNMKSTGCGWTIEMSTKILKSRNTHQEIPTSYNKRTTGHSKISGNISTSIRAALAMTFTFIRVLIFWRSTNGVKK